jgi:hypothetical protein
LTGVVVIYKKKTAIYTGSKREWSIIRIFHPMH